MNGPGKDILLQATYPSGEVVEMVQNVLCGPCDQETAHEVLYIHEGEVLYQGDAKNFVVLNNLAWVYEKVGRIEEAKSLGKAAMAPGGLPGPVGDDKQIAATLAGDIKSALGFGPGRILVHVHEI